MSLIKGSPAFQRVNTMLFIYSEYYQVISATGEQYDFSSFITAQTG